MGTSLDLALILQVLGQRRKLHQQAGWSRIQLMDYQARALEKLRSFAYAHSPFYQEFHRNFRGDSLPKLPVLTKSHLMEHFDSVLTDNNLKLQDMKNHLQNLKGDELLQGKYRVTATASTSGERGLFPFSRREWAKVLGSYLRAYDWGQWEGHSFSGFSQFQKNRMAIVGSGSPSHPPVRIGSFAQNVRFHVLVLDARDALAEVVEKLNSFQPQTLVLYASWGRILADQQMAGALAVRPRRIFCSGEVLSAEARGKIRQAFQVEPLNIYASTETGVLAVPCPQFQKWHLFEDLVLAEIVNDQYEAVPPGEYGSKLLVTVLFSRTLPLIRYEIPDVLLADGSPCRCGKPFSLVQSIEGRQEDVLHMPSKGGKPIIIYPHFFHRHLEALPVEGWQVIQKETRSLKILLVGPWSSVDQEGLARKLRENLALKGVDEPEIEIAFAERVPRTLWGKILPVVPIPFTREKSHIEKS